MTRFVEERRDRFGVELLCRVLGASPSTYYAARSRPASARAITDAWLHEEIARVFEANYRVYGARKLWHQLNREAIEVGRDRVWRLMREAGLQGARRGKTKFTTRRNEKAARPPDLVERDFTAEAPDRLWLADITYVRTWAGFCYVAFVEDVFSRMIVGWSIATHLNHDSGSERRFILVEQGRPEKGDAYARSLLANRLRRAVTGEWANGKGKAIGGGLRFYELKKKVDAKALLEMERDEMTDAVIASHFDANRRGAPSLIIMTTEGYDYLVARNSSDEGFYLIWDGSPEPPVFNEATYDAVVGEAVKAGLKPTYHVYARFNFFQSDDVRFYQIPDQILMDFGVSMNDPFNNESDVG